MTADLVPALLSLFSAGGTGLAVIGPDEEIQYANEALGRLLGLPTHGRAAQHHLSSPELAVVQTLRAAVRGVRSGGKPQVVAVAAQDGRHWRVRCVPLTLSAPRESLVGLIAVDDTEQETAIQALTHRAAHDPLTGLLHRGGFMHRLESAITRAAAPEGPPAVVLAYLDLDEFSLINSVHGHAGGDRVLDVVAARLQAMTRTGDTVARMGGDEFVLLCEGMPEQADIDSVATRIHAAVDEPVPLVAGPAWLTASVGVVRAVPGQDAAQVLHAADLAMYQAKAMRRADRSVRRALKVLLPRTGDVPSVSTVVGRAEVVLVRSTGCTRREARRRLVREAETTGESLLAVATDTLMRGRSLTSGSGTSPTDASGTPGRRAADER